jgi:hypothetical protein
MDEATKAKIKDLWGRFEALVISQRLPPETQFMMLQTTREHMFDWSLDFERAIAATRNTQAVGGPTTRPVINTVQ